MSQRLDRPSKHHVVSIHKFATGKAAFNQKKKDAEEQKRNQKSKMLREYAKICKTEGIVSDRVNLELHQGKKATDSEQPPKMKNSAPPARETNPFKDAKNEAVEKAMERERGVQAAKEKDAEIKKKNAAREVTRKQRMKRTNKGQPILSTQIASILGKLQAKPR